MTKTKLRKLKLLIIPKLIKIVEANISKKFSKRPSIGKKQNKKL